MSTTLFVIIGVVSIAAFAFARLTQMSQPPQIIYVQTVAPEPQRGLGCLPLIVIGILVIIALRLFAGA